MQLANMIEIIKETRKLCIQPTLATNNQYYLNCVHYVYDSEAARTWSGAYDSQHIYHNVIDFHKRNNRKPQYKDETPYETRVSTWDNYGCHSFCIQISDTGLNKSHQYMRKLWQNSAT